MVTITVQAEIRRAMVNELIKLNARTKDGVQMPASEFRKKYYNAEVNGEPCLLRFRDNIVVPEDLQKGQLVEVDFNTVSVESDTSQFNVLAIRPVVKK